MKTNSGCDALQTALWGKNNFSGTTYKSDLVHSLIKHGADVNSSTESFSPLAIAFSIRDPYVVRLLLQNGADPSVSLPHCHLLHVAAILVRFHL
jgi:ankyrin repeat protein